MFLAQLEMMSHFRCGVNIQKNVNYYGYAIKLYINKNAKSLNETTGFFVWTSCL